MKSLKKYATPYLIWCGVLIVLPTALLLFLSFNSINILNFENFKFTFDFVGGLTTSEVLNAIWRSVKLSVICTIICFMIGYPVAMFMCTLSKRKRALLMALLVLPLWSNQVLRIIAWRDLYEIILDKFPSINLYSETGIVIAMVSMYLTFMIVPIYTVLEKQDKKLVEASRDLGATSVQTFMKVTFPLSLSGIVSGVVMTLLPAMTAFEVPQAISKGNINLIGNIIYLRINSGEYNLGSALSLFLMIMSVLAFIMVVRVDKEGETLI